MYLDVKWIGEPDYVLGTFAYIYQSYEEKNPSPKKVCRLYDAFIGSYNIKWMKNDWNFYFYGAGAKHALWPPKNRKSSILHKMFHFR